MMIGNGSSSPVSTRPNFLPAYLMGESDTNTSKCPMQSDHMSAIYNINAGECSGLQQKFRSANNSKVLSSMSSFETDVDKLGPPKLGLFDTVEEVNLSINQSQKLFNTSGTNHYFQYFTQWRIIYK